MRWRSKAMLILKNCKLWKPNLQSIDLNGKMHSTFSGWYMFQRTGERSRQHGCEREFISFTDHNRFYFIDIRTTWCFGSCLADDIAMFRVFPEVHNCHSHDISNLDDSIGFRGVSLPTLESGESSCLFVKWWGFAMGQVIDNHSRMRGQCVIGTQSLWGAIPRCHGSWWM